MVEHVMHAHGGKCRSGRAANLSIWLTIESIRRSSRRTTSVNSASWFFFEEQVTNVFTATKAFLISCPRPAVSVPMLASRSRPAHVFFQSSRDADVVQNDDHME
jgi:hypothetical protein